MTSRYNHDETTPSHDGEQPWDESRDFATHPNEPSYETNPTEVMYAEDHANAEGGETFTTENGYDFNLAQELEKDLGFFHWDNLEPYKKSRDNEWIARPYYQELYDSYSNMGETSTYIIDSLEKGCREAHAKNEQLSNANSSLTQQAESARMSERSAINNSEERKRELDEREESLENKERNAKNLKIALIAATSILAIASIVLAFMLFNEKSHSTSVDQRGQVNQERIDDLEKSLKSANDNNSNLKAENDKLQESNSNLNNRVNDAEGNADKLNKSVQDKDKEIQRLNDELKSEQEREPETVTSTITDSVSPSTVTQTLPGSDGDTVTTTVTQTAESTN